ncbi:MAG: SUMF1/EgtB/PvdO family nonheme iron enzyme, partial [Deltaproteobacteria bacterium]|nr:SUMF1/EgtB/PvdO family nonheme iron enzyme [Deltaproteobacteria bacterium]
MPSPACVRLGFEPDAAPANAGDAWDITLDASAPDTALDSFILGPDTSPDTSPDASPDTSLDSLTANPDITVDSLTANPDITVDSLIASPDTTVDSLTASPDTTLDTSPSAVPGSWVTLPAGTFDMGSPLTEACRWEDEILHSVTLGNTFEIQTTEVTQAQYLSVIGASPSSDTTCGANCPVEMLSWHEAAAYCNALSPLGAR